MDVRGYERELLEKDERISMLRGHTNACEGVIEIQRDRVKDVESQIENLRVEIASLEAHLNEAIALIPTEEPKRPWHGRLVLNAYGRACYSMGIERGKLEATTVPCEECDGRGEYLDAPSNVLDGDAYWETCPKCSGSGRVQLRLAE